MKKVQIGEPYNVIFSNRYLATKYLHKEMKEATVFDETGENDLKNNKHPFSKTTFKKRLKTIFIYTGSCIVLSFYISLTILGGIVFLLCF